MCKKKTQNLHGFLHIHIFRKIHNIYEIHRIQFNPCSIEHIDVSITLPAVHLNVESI